MQIRPLTTLEECRRVAVLEKVIWGYTDAEDLVPPPVLIVSIKRGGILLGAFDAAGEMQGFVYSMPGVKDGRLTQWSHMLGVAPEARASGLGFQLKLAQRERALAMGIDLVEWTYDPLQTVNAHLNFARLGVVVQEYEVNVYGESSSPLHRGTPTDRCIAEWHLREPHVERRIAARRTLAVRDASLGHAPVVNPSKPGDRWLRPAEPDLSLEGCRVLVEVPEGFGEMQPLDPGLALDWRLATRAAFLAYFARGYRAVDFLRMPDARCGRYLLALPPDHRPEPRGVGVTLAAQMSGGSSRSDWMTGTSSGQPPRGPERDTSTPRMPSRRAPSMSCSRLSPTINASPGAASTCRSAASKMLGCGFM